MKNIYDLRCFYFLSNLFVSSRSCQYKPTLKRKKLQAEVSEMGFLLLFLVFKIGGKILSRKCTNKSISCYRRVGDLGSLTLVCFPHSSQLFLPPGHYTQKSFYYFELETKGQRRGRPKDGKSESKRERERERNGIKREREEKRYWTAEKRSFCNSFKVPGHEHRRFTSFLISYRAFKLLFPCAVIDFSLIVTFLLLLRSRTPPSSPHMWHKH